MLPMLASFPVLGATMVGATAIGLVYATLSVLTNDDPLAGILIPLVVLPCAIPLIFGTFLWLGHGWALIALRITLVVLVVGLIGIDRLFALNLFIVLPVMNVAILFYVAWFALSFAVTA